MSDPIKNYGNNREFYDLLRAVNPHLPVPEVVSPVDLQVILGDNVIARVRLEVFITLPDLDKIWEVTSRKDEDLIEAAIDRDAFTHGVMNMTGRYTWACGCVTITPPSAPGPSEMHVHAFTCKFHTPIKESS